MYIDFNCFIVGQHIHQDIRNLILQEELTCERELSNCHNKYAIKVVQKVKLKDIYHIFFQKRLVLLCYLTAL